MESCYKYLRDEKYRRITNNEAIKLKSEHNYNALFCGAAQIAFSMGFNFAKRRGMQKDDFISMANLATINAIKSWNSKKYEFDKYIRICIKRSLFEECGKYAIFKIPRTTWGDLSKLRKLTDNGTFISVSELSLLMGKNKERILEILELKEILTLRKNAEVFDRSYKKSREFNCIEIAPDIFPCLAEVENLLKFIDNEERKQLFVLKYGLLGNKVHSYTELTQKTVYTKDYIVYQIMLCIKELGEIVKPTIKIVKNCKVCNKSFTPLKGRENKQNTCGNRQCANTLSKRNIRLKLKIANNAKNVLFT